MVRGGLFEHRSGIISSRSRTPLVEEEESNVKALFTFAVDINL